MFVDVSPAGAARNPRLKTVGTDPAGDWGAAIVGQAGTAQGADLTRASIGMHDASTLRFVIEVAELPAAPPQGLPIPVGYAWDFTIGDGRMVFELQSCEPDFPICIEEASEAQPDEAMFIVMAFADCRESACSAPVREVRGVVAGRTDTARGTITVDVPLFYLADSETSLLPKRGAVISPSDMFGPALRTFTVIGVAGPEDSEVHMIPNDDLDVSKNFVLPRTKGAKR